jgi:hypothetical protein
MNCAPTWSYMPPAAILCRLNSAMCRLRSAQAQAAHFAVSAQTLVFNRPHQGCRVTAYGHQTAVDETAPGDVDSDRRWSCSSALISAGRGNLGALPKPPCCESKRRPSMWAQLSNAANAVWSVISP